MARHSVHFYLEGGHEIVVKVKKLEVQVTEEGNIAGYTLENLPSEQLSYLYFKPSSIVGIKSILLEADEPEEEGGA